MANKTDANHVSITRNDVKHEQNHVKPNDLKLNDLKLNNLNANDLKPIQNDVEKASTRSSVNTESNLKYREREQWGSKIEFMLSCIAFSIGLGNVWR